jgi:hypothetical protein
MWVATMLREVVAAGLMTIDSVVINTLSPEAIRRKSRFSDNDRSLSSLLYAVFLRFDARPLASDPFALDDLRPLCEGCSVREVTPRQTARHDYFEEEDLLWLRERAPDVALRFGFRALRGDVLNAAVAGVWSFEHGDTRCYRGGPPGFWEVIEGAAYTGAVLRRLSEELDGGRILYRTNVPTHPVSVSLTREAVYWAASRGLSAALRQLGNSSDPASREHFGLNTYSRSTYTTPRATESIKAIAQLVTRRISRAVTVRPRKLQWHLGYSVDSPDSPHHDVPGLSPHRLDVISSPFGSLWADPFAVLHERQHWVFFEEVPPGERHGRISVIPIGPEGQPGKARVVLSRPHHLSYPCIFRYDNQWYMAPESYDAGRQEILVAKNFPYEWESYRTFFDGDPIVDPTIFELNGKWWLMGSRPTPRTLVGDELHAWFADSPLGSWTPHPLNPLRAGSDGSRPAGLPFLVAGRLYRPGQLGAPHYGTGVRLFEVEELTPTRYSEHIAGEIVPRWNSVVHGYHTINSVAGLSVGDLLIDRRR